MTQLDDSMPLYPMVMPRYFTNHYRLHIADIGPQLVRHEPFN